MVFGEMPTRVAKPVSFRGEMLARMVLRATEDSN
jgi:hypothetical protein